eukprot:5484442-Heterocapsa_arctica.AAC.1
MALAESRLVPWSRTSGAVAGLAAWTGCRKGGMAGLCGKPSDSSAMEVAKREIISCSLSAAVA